MASIDVAPHISANIKLALARTNGLLDHEIQQALNGVVFAGKALAGAGNAKPYNLPSQSTQSANVETANPELDAEHVRVAASLHNEREANKLALNAHTEKLTQPPEKGILQVVAEGGRSPFEQLAQAQPAPEGRSPNGENQQPALVVGVDTYIQAHDDPHLQNELLRTHLGLLASLAPAQVDDGLKTPKLDVPVVAARGGPEVRSV